MLIPTLLHGAGGFGFFFFLDGSARVACFPHGGCRRGGGTTAMSSDDDNYSISYGGLAGAMVSQTSTPVSQHASGTAET